MAMYLTEDLLDQVHRTAREDELTPDDKKIWGSKRMVVGIYIFFGHAYMCLLRVNLSIAMVEMTSNKTIHSGNQTIVEPAEFSWNSKTKGFILSAFMYGYTFAWLGGYFATKYGGVRIYGVGILLTAGLTALTPFTIRINLYLFILGRIAEGLFESFSYAGSADIWSHWMPKNEIPLFVGLAQVGYFSGTVLTFPLCGYIAHRWGWPVIFYFSGGIALTWCMFFFTHVKNEPASQNGISTGELRYIRSSIGVNDRKNIRYPWRKIFTSKALWAMCAGKFGYSWASTFLMICFPLYIKDMTDKSTFEVGIISGIPNYSKIIGSIISGWCLYRLQNKENLDFSKLHKNLLSSIYLCSGILFFFVGFTNFITSMVAFVLILLLLSANNNILQSLAMYIAPDHAGIVAGITSLWYTISSLIAPLVMGFIVTNHTWNQWSFCFKFSGIVLIIVALITKLFASSADQKWSLPQEENSYM